MGEDERDMREWLFVRGKEGEKVFCIFLLLSWLRITLTPSVTGKPCRLPLQREAGLLIVLISLQ